MTAAGVELTFVAYSSRAVHPFSESELEQLLVESRARNTASNISGLLLYRQEKFIQFLEGPTEHVLELMESIGRDDRHEDVTILWREQTTARRFAEWTMGYRTMREPAESHGFRSSFDDLEDPADIDNVVQAVRDLTIWFRVRSDAPLPR